LAPSARGKRKINRTLICLPPQETAAPEKNILSIAPRKVISYVKWQSIGWAILHGAMSWGYVIYYFFKYVKT